MSTDHRTRRNAPEAWWIRPVGRLPQWIWGGGSRRFEKYELNHLQTYELKQVETKAMGGMGLIVMVGGIVALTIGFRALRANVSFFVAYMIMIAAFLPIGLGLRMWKSNSKTLERARNRKLREFDVPVCAHCGYDLSGGDPNEGPCPECGSDLSGMPPVRTAEADHSSSSPPSSSD